MLHSDHAGRRGMQCLLCSLFLAHDGKVKYFWYRRGGTLGRWLYFLVKKLVLRFTVIPADTFLTTCRPDTGRKLNYLFIEETGGMTQALRLPSKGIEHCVRPYLNRLCDFT
jgi:hypothetical protein